MQKNLLQARALPTLSSPQSGSPGNQTIGGLVVVVVDVVVVL